MATKTFSMFLFVCLGLLWPVLATADQAQGDGFPAIEIAPPFPPGPTPKVVAVRPHWIDSYEALDPAAQSAATALAWIVQSRDVSALKQHLGANVTSSFGGNGGVDEFIQHWNLASDGRASPLWGVLARLLDAGPIYTAEDGGSFTFPYYFDLWPDETPGGLDVYRSYFAWGQAVPLKAAPQHEAELVRMLCFEAVRAEYKEAEGDDDWLFAETSDGLSGYVSLNKVAHLLDYRLLISIDGDDWTITHLVAGD